MISIHAIQKFRAHITREYKHAFHKNWRESSPSSNLCFCYLTNYLRIQAKQNNQLGIKKKKLVERRSFSLLRLMLCSASSNYDKCKVGDKKNFPVFKENLVDQNLNIDAFTNLFLVWS